MLLKSWDISVASSDDKYPQHYELEFFKSMEHAR